MDIFIRAEVAYVYVYVYISRKLGNYWHYFILLKMLKYKAYF